MKKIIFAVIFILAIAVSILATENSTIIEKKIIGYKLNSSSVIDVSEKLNMLITEINKNSGNQNPEIIIFVTGFSDSSGTVFQQKKVALDRAKNFAITLYEKLKEKGYNKVSYEYSNSYMVRDRSIDVLITIKKNIVFIVGRMADINKDIESGEINFMKIKVYILCFLAVFFISIILFFILMFMKKKTVYWPKSPKEILKMYKEKLFSGKERICPFCNSSVKAENYVSHLAKKCTSEDNPVFDTGNVKNALEILEK